MKKPDLAAGLCLKTSPCSVDGLIDSRLAGCGGLIGFRFTPLVAVLDCGFELFDEPDVVLD